jgi:hypothetical protein
LSYLAPDFFIITGRFTRQTGLTLTTRLLEIPETRFLFDERECLYNQIPSELLYRATGRAGWMKADSSE